ncbi:MAG: hypothetical protein PW788_01420 [Micavibrio sp.]|nr:hypothetical protein [Micavibrio sp.]
MEDNKKDQKGWLSTTFRKAVLTGVTAIALAGGLATEASAQQYQGQGQQVTAQVQKPWAGDPQYQRQINDYEYASQLRMQRLNANEQAQMANLNNWHAQQLARSIQNGQRASRGGFTFGEILTTGNQAGAVEANYRAKQVQIHTNAETARLRETENLERQEANLDNAYAKKYGATLRVTSPAPRVATSQPANGALSADQQHDRLVRAYQDAQLSSAKSGKPMPKPETFGLSPRDPAIAPQ